MSEETDVQRIMRVTGCSLGAAAYLVEKERADRAEARLAEAEAERDDQIKWASHYAARAGQLEDALMHLHQAYANKHSPQHRASALNLAWGVLNGPADSAPAQETAND